MLQEPTYKSYKYKFNKDNNLNKNKMYYFIYVLIFFTNLQCRNSRVQDY